MGLAITTELRHNGDMAKLWDMIQKAETKRAQPAKPAKAAEGATPRKKGRPRIEERHLTLTAQKPWEALGMSRRTWERRQKEKHE